MVNKTIKYNIKYLENCNYEASELKEECQIPQQNVNIDINIENISAPKRKGYNEVTQLNYQTNNKTYYNDVLKVTVSLSIENVPSSIVNIGSISANYLNENMEAESIFGTNLPVSKDGQVIFTFKPHRSGYIQIIYNDETNFFIEKKEQSNFIKLDKIPIDTHTFSNPMFIEREKETELISEVVDVYGNKISYGHVVFLGYHDIPRDSEDPSAGHEVVLGNPAPVINGVAKITYVPEQDIDVEYVVGHYNYLNESYGSNFKYYEAHGSHTKISVTKEDTLNFAIGVVKDNNIVSTTIFDGFIHLEEGDTIRANAHLYDNENNEVTIKDDMELKIHIEGTKHIITQSYSNAKPTNVEAWMKNNVIFEEYKYETNIKDNSIDINDIPPGYYNVYATFKDTKNRDDDDRIYYKDYTSDITYINVHQPSVNINPVISYINPVPNENNTYKAQVNDNISANLKVTCTNGIEGLKGYFIINDIKYKAIYKNGVFTPEKNIKINKIGDYYIRFLTEPGYYANKGYYPMQSATPIILQVRDILQAKIEIPDGYVDNQYPGQIKYILSVDNWYDETGVNIVVKVKDIIKNTEVETYTELYKGSAIQKQISNLPPSTYQIEATINGKTTLSTKHTINKANLKGEVNELSGLTITNGIPTNIQYNIEAKKSILSEDIINQTKIYAKKDNKIISFNINENNININREKTLLSIYYPILLYIDGEWDIKFVQEDNPTFDSDIFIPNSDNINSFLTEAKTFTVKRIESNIQITKDNDNIEIIVGDNNTLYNANNQVLLLKIKITYGSAQDIEFFALTTRMNSVTIPLVDISEDFESSTIRQQIYNIKVTLDPFNNALMDRIEGLSVEDSRAIILEEYDNLYNIQYLDDFATQIQRDMLYTSLFGTYNKTIKSEKYGN